MSKHFKAIHKETGKEFEFNFEDIRSGQECIFFGDDLVVDYYYAKERFNYRHEGVNLTEDYTLFYQHENNWYPYEERR